MKASAVNSKDTILEYIAPLTPAKLTGGFPCPMIFSTGSSDDVYRCFMPPEMADRGTSRNIEGPGRRRGFVVKIDQGPPLQGFKEQPLDDPHHPVVLGGYQCDGIPPPIRPTCAADAVDVTFGSVGNIVVNDMGNLGDVDPPGRDIGGGKDTVRTVTEAVHGFLAAILRKVALQRRRLVSRLQQLLTELLGSMLRPGEDEYGTGLGLPQKLHQKPRLQVLRHRVDGVAYRDGRGRLPHLDR